MKRWLLGAGIFASALLGASSALGAQSAAGSSKGMPLPRCLLYNSYRLTPQGMMQCSYQCGDRIIMRSGYQVCAESWARPEPGKP